MAPTAPVGSPAVDLPVGRLAHDVWIPPGAAGFGGAGAEGPAVPVALACGLAAVHVGASHLGFLDVVPRSRLLSAGSGASVSYVFVHVLPEIEAARRTVERGALPLTFVERHVYLIALVGFAAFYGLEQFVVSGRRDEDGPTDEPPDGNDLGDAVFRVHVGSFAVYNLVIGYLLVHREVAGPGGVAVYAVVMGLHLLVVDYGLRDHHRDAYRRMGRWILAAALPVGTALGIFLWIPEGAVAVLFAFLAGGIVLNSIKEELPEERESRFPAFAAGAAAYAGLLLLL